MSNYRIETKCVQSGYEPGNGEPRVLPIYQSTTFRYTSSEQMGRLFDLEESGYFYTRLQNPTNDAVAQKITELEGGVAGMLTSSGQAANYYAVFNICGAGDHLVCSATVYGGTSNLFVATTQSRSSCINARICADSARISSTVADSSSSRSLCNAASSSPVI